MSLQFKNTPWYTRAGLILTACTALFFGACAQENPQTGGGGSAACGAGQSVNTSTNQCEADLTAEQLNIKKDCVARGLEFNQAYSRCDETALSCRNKNNQVVDPLTKQCKLPIESPEKCQARGVSYNEQTGLCNESSDSCQKLLPAKILGSDGQCVAASETIESCASRQLEFNKATGMCAETPTSCASKGRGYDGMTRSCTETAANSTSAECTSRGLQHNPTRNTCMETPESCRMRGMEFDNANPSLAQCAIKQEPSLLNTLIGTVLPSIIPVLIGGGGNNSSSTCSLDGSTYNHGAGANLGGSIKYCCNGGWSSNTCN